MKKYLFYYIIITAIFSACKKDDSHLFNTSPDQRLNDTLTSYQNQLSSATNGWKAFIYPKSGGVYSFYFKFNNANRVVMLSSFDSASAVTPKESSYRLKALQQPSLLFDTYSYLHVLADPNPNINGGVVGAGLQSDFEFYFASTSADTINLVGRVNGSRAVLIKATPDEASGFLNGELAAGFLLNKILTYYKRLTTNAGSIDFHIDFLARTISLPDATGNLLDSVLSTGYYMTFGGIGFTKPLSVGNQDIIGISNISYNASTQTVSCVVNNSSSTISNVTVPSKIDIGAPKRWWNTTAANDNSYWVSIFGFHVNGVEDAYKLFSIPGYNFLYYKPNYSTYNGVNYDLLSPIVNDSLNYGAAYVPPTFTSNGHVIFNIYGILGTVPPDQNNVFKNLSTKFAEASGWYVVQTGEHSYDMVSAFDGKSWISWQ